jgi:hypothetical protein
MRRLGGVVAILLILGLAAVGLISAQRNTAASSSAVVASNSSSESNSLAAAATLHRSSSGAASIAASRRTSQAGLARRDMIINIRAFLPPRKSFRVADLKREHLIDQVCLQEILPPEET